MNNEEYATILARLALLNPNLSPDLLHKATDVPVDLCIEFLSYMVSGEICGFNYPEKRKKKT